MPRVKEQLSRITPLSFGMVLLFAAAMTFFLFRAFAASGGATLYTSPSGSQSAYVGQNFTVDVRISTGSSVPVTGASIYMSYPADKLQIVSESYGGPYNTQLSVNDSGGVLRMDRAAFPAISGGDQLFAQVTFKAKAAGSAAIGFTGSSIVTSGEDDSNILSQKGGVTYDLSAPPPSTPPGSGSGGSSGGGSSSGSGGGGSSGSSQGGGSSSGSSGSSGSGGSSGSSQGGSGGGSSSGSTGGSGQSAGGSGQSGSTTHSVKVAVSDSHNKPVVGAEVTLNGQTMKTDKNGTAYFNDVPTGDQSVTIRYNGRKTSSNLHVKDTNSTQTPQVLKVSIKRNKFSPVLIVAPVLLLLLIGVLIIRPWDKWLRPSFVNDETVKVVSSDHPQTPNPTLFIASAPQQPPQYQHKKEAPGAVYEPGSDNKPGGDVKPSGGDSQQPPKIKTR